MAAIESNTRSQNKDAKKFHRRKQVFVDLTPMVDLAFLLISFFMLTTAMTTPKSMVLHMPDTTANAPVLPEHLMTLIADKDNILWYYQGMQADGMQMTDYSVNGVRKLLKENVARVIALPVSGKGLVCIIKTTDEAKYANLISLLDEMVITGVPVYAVQEITPREKEAIARAKK